MPRAPRPELMALLADVKQNPDDLTPWLVLCDWLEDQHDEADRARGEYCRLCFDKLGKKTYASGWERGERRRALYRQYHGAWLGPLGLLRPEVKGGLLTIRSESLSQYAEAMEADPEAWAWVGTLEIHHEIAELFSPGFGLGWTVAGLNTLDIFPKLSDREVGVLASCPALRSVQELRIRLPAMKTNLARCLVESANLADLPRLRIHCWDRRGGPTSARERAEAVERLQAGFGERLRIVELNISMDEDIE